MESNITALLERNDAFARSERWRKTPRLPFLPFKGLYVVTCIDPRTDPAEFLGLAFAEAIVARTVGGRVTDAVIRDLSYIGYLVETIAPEGPYFEVAVIHHTGCGSRLLEQPELRHGFAEHSGYDEATLARLPATVPAQTVSADVELILAAPQISSRISVSGHVYHTETGRLETVVDRRLVAETRGGSTESTGPVA
ncbi:MAG: carbonic anhydrase [Vulcanimicrobiaceae bacterium]|jgi:carbonic anhydrase